jgi:hypothetical protein
MRTAFDAGRERGERETSKEPALGFVAAGCGAAYPYRAEGRFSSRRPASRLTAARRGSPARGVAPPAGADFEPRPDWRGSFFATAAEDATQIGNAGKRRTFRRLSCARRGKAETAVRHVGRDTEQSNNAT